MTSLSWFALFDYQRFGFQTKFSYIFVSYVYFMNWRKKKKTRQNKKKILLLFFCSYYSVPCSCCSYKMSHVFLCPVVLLKNKELWKKKKDLEEKKNCKKKRVLLTVQFWSFHLLSFYLHLLSCCFSFHLLIFSNKCSFMQFCFPIIDFILESILLTVLVVHLFALKFSFLSFVKNLEGKNWVEKGRV